MNNKMKKTTALVVSAMIVTAGLCGCGSSEKQNQVSSDEEKVSGVPAVVATVDGTEIDGGLLNYYIYQAAVKEEYKDNPNFDGDFASVNWDEKAEDGRTKGDRVKESAIKELLGKQLVVALAEKNGISMTDEEKSQADENLNQFKENYGEEAFKANMGAMGLSSAEDYMKLFELETIYLKAETDFVANPDKYVSVNLEEYSDSEQICAQHILIQNDSDKFSDPAAGAEEVLAKAKSEENFADLIEEYNEDPGETAAGYCFGRGEMVTEFENAAFALNYNEISDVVKTEYGYHIIKRVVGLAELKNYLLQTADIQKSEEEKVSVADVMKSIDDSMKKANELNSLNA